MNERDMVVLEYMEYAKERARWWKAKHPQLADDIMGTAMLALVRAVNTQPLHVKGCISKFIDNAMADLINDNDIIHIPRVTRRTLLKEDKTLDHLPKAYIVEPTELIRRSKRHPPWVIMHIAEVMDLLNLSDYERQILELRRDGHTFREIGAKMDRSYDTMHYTINKIAERYIRLVNSHPEILKPWTDENS